MLIYEKKVIENDELVRHLFGTTGHIPSDSDLQLTYTDADGDVVTDLTILSQLLDDGKGGIKTKDGEKILVWLDDLNIIPGTVQEGVSKLVADATDVKTEYVEEDDDKLDLTGLVVKAVYIDGTVETLTSEDYTTDPVSGATLTVEDTAVTISGAEGTDYEGFETSFAIKVDPKQEENTEPGE